MSGIPQTAQEEQAAPLTRSQWATVVAGTILDIIGVLVTIAAMVVLTLNDGTDRKWWWAVGLASVLAVFTTVLLTRLGYQHRRFIKASKALAEHLERLAQQNKTVPSALQELAVTRRDAAQASGHLAVADRLTIALARSS
jgi:ABC-type multidrug transport system fused ATPase/permease subunit